MARSSMASVFAPLKRDILGAHMGQHRLEMRFEIPDRAVNATRIGSHTNSCNITKLAVAVEEVPAAFRELKASGPPSAAAGPLDPRIAPPAQLNGLMLSIPKGGVDADIERIARKNNDHRPITVMQT